MATLWATRHDRLRQLWPGVDPHDVCSALAHIDAIGIPEGSGQIEEALQLSGAEAASALMAPVASSLDSVPWAERVGVFHALDALIRAGGDPAPALPALARGVGDSRTVKPACEALRRAALAGYSIAPVREHLSEAARHDSSVHAVQRLEALQRRGQHAELRSLSAIYRQQQPIGNLHEGIGLVEQSLVSDVQDDVAGARLALAELERAGSDFYRCWIALLPVLSRQLRATDRERRVRAATALAQVEFAIGRSTELTKHDAANLVVPLLHPALDGLTALLGGEDAERRASATTIELFVGIGCSLAEVRPRIDVALGDERVEVRSACSRALSTHLRRAGEETPLPPGCSHRRTYASADNPIGERKARCPSCDAVEAALIYESRDRGNTWDDTTIELKCCSCQIYAVQHFGQ